MKLMKRIEEGITGSDVFYKSNNILNMIPQVHTYWITLSTYIIMLL